MAVAILRFARIAPRKAQAYASENDHGSRGHLRHGVRFCALIAACMSVASGVALAADPVLVVKPAQGPSYQVTLADLSALSPEDLAVQDEKGHPARYRCVSVAKVLAHAGAPLPTLRGKAMTGALRVNAADGYAVLFALPELDPEFTSGQVFVCFERDGAAMSDEEGPLRMVVPAEKKHARWVRRVTEFEVLPPLVREN